MPNQEVTFKVNCDASKATAEFRKLAVAATVSQKQIATGTKQTATGVSEFSNAIRQAAAAVGVLQGPLNGISGRITAFGTLAKTAGADLATVGTAATTTGASVASMAGPIGIAVAAVAGLTIGLGLLAKEIFDLANKTAEYEGKLFDLSKQTNFSVETLSALTLAAKTSGGSIDSVASSLAIFQANMVKAAEGNKEYAKTFRDLKIDTTNQEQALRQAITSLFRMGETEKQSAEAKKLFGKAAKDVLGIIKETNGNLDEAIDRYTKLNLLVSTEAAIAADTYSDSLEELTEQFAAMGRVIGNAAIPVLIAFFDEMSDGLGKSQAQFLTWSDTIANGMAFLLGMAEALGGAFKEMSIAGWAAMPGNVLINATRLQNTARRDSLLTSVSAVTQGAANMVGRTRPSSGGGGGGGKAKKANTDLADADKEAALAEKEAQQALKVNETENKRALEEKARDIEEFTKRAIQLADERRDITIDRITAESNALNKALDSRAIKQEEYERKQRGLDLEAKEAHQENSDEIFKLEQERDRQISEAELAHAKRSLEIAEDEDARQIKRIEYRIKNELHTEEEGERQIAEIVDQGFERRRKALESEREAYATTLERRAEINDELIRLDGQRADAAEDAARRIIKAAFDEQNAQAEGATRKRSITDPNDNSLASIVGQATEAGGAFLGLGTVIQETMGLAADNAAVFGDIISSTFNQIGQAVGEAVKSFILFGSVKGSFRQFAAEVIASVAQMAAVQAVFELAQGLAMLALAYFFPNVKYFQSAGAHFAAAAMFGAIGLGATVAGRMVAGNSFQAAAGGGGGAGVGKGGTEAPDKPQTTEQNRRNYEPVIHIVMKDGVHDLIEASVVKNWNNNGRIRNVVQKDGG